MRDQRDNKYKNLTNLKRLYKKYEKFGGSYIYIYIKFKKIWTLRASNSVTC